MNTRHFLRALPGLLLIAIGIIAIAYAPTAQSCVTDYDLTVCEVTGSAIVYLLGYVLVLAGVIAAMWAIRGTRS
jgi:uncharacterized membrane protein YidH (DUF202 family)